MTTDLERLQQAVAADIRANFDTGTDPDRWAVIVLLSRLGVDYPGPRVSPSSHEEALVALAASSDLPNLRLLYRLYPDMVRAYAIYAYEPGGYDRLKAIAAEGPTPDETLIADALAAYELARSAGHLIETEAGHGHTSVDVASTAFRHISDAAQMLPRLAGALDRALRGAR